MFDPGSRQNVLGTLETRFSYNRHTSTKSQGQSVVPVSHRAITRSRGCCFCRRSMV